MHDIRNRQDIELLVDTFYVRVQADELLSPIFSNLEHFNWDTHIPVMYSFWETVLLGSISYKGNPMRTHIELNKKIRIDQLHFTRWRELFFATIDDLFAGDIANSAKHKVLSMEPLMLFKIRQSEDNHFIQ
jgi:hemoglobin